jgi:exonuclease III
MEKEIYNCLSSKSQIKFLQCLQKFSIRRFIDILTLQEQEIILQDLAYSQRKTHHYMWWGFPQEKGSWGKHIVSDKT